MRTAFVLALLTCTAARASELYVVPVFARHLHNGTTAWQSAMYLTNPHQHPVTLAIETTIGEVDPHGCRFPEFSLGFPESLGPGETQVVCIGFTSKGAFAFRASDEVVVTSEVIAFHQPRGTTTRQTVELGRRWIEAEERATIFHVRADAPSVRANLIVVNPESAAITVRYSLVRAGHSPPVNHDYEPVTGQLDVPGRSVVLLPLPDAPRHDCGRLVPCGNAVEHTLAVEGTGRFYAATSSVENEVDATFRSPWGFTGR